MIFSKIIFAIEKNMHYICQNVKKTVQNFLVHKEAMIPSSIQEVDVQ